MNDDRTQGRESFNLPQMICPECKAEYREGFTRCTDCGMKLLVAAAHANMPETPAAKFQPEASAVLWRGQDPVAFSVVLNALDEQGMFYKEFQRRDYAAALSQPVALGFYGLPHWEVRVCATDLNAARIIAEEALRPVSALAVEMNWANEALNSDRDSTEAAGAPKPLHAPVKIWSGEETHLAQQLLDALISQRIRCWSISTFPSGEDLLVCQQDEERALGILRGVLERTSAA